MSDVVTTCTRCGLPIRVGDFPCIETIRPHEPWHGRAVPVFVPYFDEGLGADVTSIHHRLKLMRDQNLVDRPKLTKGDLSARADKAHERRKQEAS
jgi:hypothetical protein